MSASPKCELLQIHPTELRFPFELKKQASCSVKLSNNSSNYVAFKVMTTNPKNYCVLPKNGVVLAHSTCDIKVIMRDQEEYPADIQCKDTFLVCSVVVKPGFTAKDITPETFNEKSGSQLADEGKLRVSYVLPRSLKPLHFYKSYIDGILEAVLNCIRPPYLSIEGGGQALVSTTHSTDDQTRKTTTKYMRGPLLTAVTTSRSTQTTTTNTKSSSPPLKVQATRSKKAFSFRCTFRVNISCFGWKI